MDNSPVIVQMEVSHMMVFAYIVGCRNTGKALVIDPAADSHRIVGEASRLGLEITLLVNTHAHVDHIMGNADMVERTGAKIVLHRDDLPLMRSQSRGLFEMFGGRPSPPPDILVEEGDDICVGNVVLKVIHTPGHSPGGISLYTRGSVFTGDTLFVGGVGRTDLPGGSWRVLLSSIKEKLFVLPPDTVIYPGHNYGDSPTSTIGREMTSNPYL